MESTDLWLPLGTALIAATAAIAGGAVGPVLGGRREHNQWLRDKRADAYANYFEVLQRAEREAFRFKMEREIDIVEVPTAPSGALIRELFKRASGLETFGSLAVSERATSTAGAFQAYVLSAEYPDKEARTEDFYREFQDEAARVRKLIRRDLGVKDA